MFAKDPNKIDQVLRSFNRQIEEEEAQSQAALFGLPYINLKNFPIDLNVLSELSKSEAKNSESLVFYKDKNDLRIATLNPGNPLIREKIGLWQKKYQTKLYIISKSNFESVLKFYDKIVENTSVKDDALRVLPPVSELSNLNDLVDFNTQQKLNYTELLCRIFGSAVNMGASDIHLEPESDFVKVRFRLDGVLQEVLRLNKFLHLPLVSRLKMQAKLKLNITNVPQDGRLTFFFNTSPIDVRVSSLPSVFGESMVMRLLNVSELQLNFSDLGFFGRALEVVNEALNKPTGMLLTTGPTGSGKTTTLYTFLRDLNKPGVKIITIEDPVEYRLEGITQTPIDQHANFGFASALKAILRQDPDIVMVGEIRDEETAGTAAQAALTGHVVLSTLHTNDAAGAIPRLYNMGVKPFVLGPALNCVIAQRLVRKLCQGCKKPYEPDVSMLKTLTEQFSCLPKNSKIVPPKNPVFYISVGCDKCHNTGYKGRLGIFEVIEMTTEMQSLILKQPSMGEIKSLAISQGMVTLLQDALLKATQGFTDLPEVFRVVSA